MPRAQDLARQNRGEIDSVKAAGAGAVMRCAATDERLREEEQRDDGEVLDRRALAGRRHAGEHLRMHMPAPPAPSKEVEPPEREQHRGRRAEQRDQAECAP